VGSPYRVPVASILRDVPSLLEVDFRAPFDAEHEFPPRGPAETDVFSEAEVRVRLRLQSYRGGIRATGEVEAPWHGSCRRCSAPVLGVSRVRVDERFVEPPGVDEEDYLIEVDEVDLAPLVHDAVFLDLPLAPLCREACRGLCPTCGVDRNEETCDCPPARDVRWAMLDALVSEPDPINPDDA
jgi:uncharacterized protein